MQVFFVVGWGRGHKLFCEHQRHWPVRGGRYKARFVFALLLCDFLHSAETIFVVFCSHKELPGLVFFSSLRISALLCQPSLIASVAAN